MSQIVLQQVGVVRSPFQKTADVPGSGAAVEIEVFAPFERELEGVDRSSHLIIVGYFHQRTHPAPGPGRRRHGQACGAFASRCPERPTPIALTVGRLIGRDGLRLLVDHVDLVDGTPVLDLKPYIPGWDAVFSATRRRRVRQAEISDRELYDFLALDLSHHLGADAALPAARTALGAVLLAVKRLGLEPRDPGLGVTVNRCDATADALMGLLGATLGSGRVAVQPSGGPVAFRFRAGGRILDLCEMPATAASIAALPDIIAPAFAARGLETIERREVSEG
jgi:tRNA-Thr(GGU) m(6)t(6)A37 methyltransferase TsaA